VWRFPENDRAFDPAGTQTITLRGGALLTSASSPEPYRITAYVSAVSPTVDRLSLFAHGRPPALNF
jgi:hypothetical protein